MRGRRPAPARSAPSPDAVSEGAREPSTMWDVLTWHNGTLAIAWWAVLAILFLALVAAGGNAAKR